MHRLYVHPLSLSLSLASGPAQTEPAEPSEHRLWKLYIASLSEEAYKAKYLGTGFVDVEETGPPFTDVEWSIHPGSLMLFATVMSSACMSGRKVPGLTVDIEREPKSGRAISVVTNASPSLESFILSIVSHLHFCPIPYSDSLTL